MALRMAARSAACPDCRTTIPAVSVYCPQCGVLITPGAKLEPALVTPRMVKVAVLVVLLWIAANIWAQVETARTMRETRTSIETVRADMKHAVEDLSPP